MKGIPMQITDELISHLEDLSCLVLSAEEKATLKKDLTDILKGMEKLNELDTTGVPARSHPFDHTNVFREDIVEASYPRELILRNAEMHNDEAFIAPRTVE